MIRFEEDTFLLETKSTLYAFCIHETGLLEHLYYGPAMNWTGDSKEALRCKNNNPDGNSIAYDGEHENLNTDNIPLEVSGVGKGDFRQPFIELYMPDGNSTADFVYASHEVIEKSVTPEGLPGIEASADTRTLVLTLKEKNYPVSLKLFYVVIPENDCIVRFASLINEGSDTITIERLMSTQLDLNDGEYDMVSFHGDWTGEMNRVDTPIKGVRVVNSSNTGNSSNHANPFVMLIRRGMTEYTGEGYAINLIYSGNHYEAAEGNGHNRTRFLAGINPERFSWELKGGDSFDTPQAVMTYSGNGFDGIMKHMHSFVRENVVRGEWKDKERPILINSWEACYFKFNEHKLLNLAKAAKKTGMELFVLDDGWFGNRNDDTSSLGDWTVNRKKLPGGLSGIAKKIKAIGMSFGLWVEPEMINSDSELYRLHPDWAVKAPMGGHSTGRHQMILDLTRREVRDNVVEQMTEVFSSGDISYVKWDMNRNFSDCFSPSLPPKRQGEFAHRYILGLYDIMKRLTEGFPHILFEGCASGGNRFDLGMLCYMPQIWASDNTDALCRRDIQNNYYYGYPQSVMGAHVSGVPNHQTLRSTPLDTRFNVAGFGVLGYECNLCDMSKEELKEISRQIEAYKKFRKTLQYGQLHRMENTPNRTSWVVVSEDKKQAVGNIVQSMVRPNDSYMNFRTRDLEEGMNYHFYNNPAKVNISRFGDLINTMTPFHIKPGGFLHKILSRVYKLDGEKEDYTVSGGLLNGNGIVLAQSYTGAGLAENTRIFGDYDSRMYYMEAVWDQT